MPKSSMAMHTGAAQALEYLESQIDILHGHALGDLELETLRFDPRLLDGRLDSVNQRELAELARGKIHGHPEIGEAEVPEGAGLMKGGAQHPIADQHDESALFGHGQATSRRHEPALRMPPSQECLHAHDAIG